MLASLRVRMLVASGGIVLLAALGGGQATYDAVHQAQSQGTRANLRDQIERLFLRIESRHERTVRRAREATQDPRRDTRVAMLTWSAEHYLGEMERLVIECQAAVQSGAASETALASNLERLDRQVARILVQARDVGRALDRLLEVASLDPPEDMSEGLRALERSDARVLTQVRIAEGLLRRTFRSPMRDQRVPLSTWTLTWWVLWLVALPVLAWSVARPVARITHLARTGSLETGSPASTEEQLLQQRLKEHQRLQQEHETRQSQDAAEQRRSLQSLRRLEREVALLGLYNENLVNSLRSAIIATDASGAVQSFNVAARRWFHLDDSVLGQPLAEVPVQGSVEAHRPDMSRELERVAAGTSVRLEGVPHRDTGGTRLFDVTLAPYVDEGGATRGVLWIVDDVTEAMETKNQLLAAEHLAAIGRISAQVAHEVRNPLSAIGLNAELLEEEFAAGLAGAQRDEAIALLKAIAAEIERLSEITESYLQLARPRRPEIRVADLNQLVADLFAMLGPQMRSSHIEVQLELATPSPRVHVDPGQLRQAMLNVVSNSAEAMPDGGLLRVRTAVVENRCVVEFSDTGGGIPEGLAKRVFEPFFTTKAEGTGLGLSLTHQIIEEHGGEITLESSTAGTVTRIAFNLASSLDGPEPDIPSGQKTTLPQKNVRPHTPTPNGITPGETR